MARRPDPPLMPDAPFMISPAGFIAQPNWNASPQPGLGPNLSPGSPATVTSLLPGGILQLVGTGEFDLIGNQLGGARGALQVDLVTGTAGTNQALAFLLQTAGVSTIYLGFSLDTTNRPKFIITDVSGTQVAAGSLSGAAIAAGTPLSLRLFWDSAGSVFPPFVAWTVNGIAQTVSTLPSTPWKPFFPSTIICGQGGPGSNVDFVGQLGRVQASNVP